MPTQTTPTWLEVLRLIVDLLKSLTWPVIALAAFLVFRQPIEQIAVQLPAKFAAATKVGVGSLVLEIQRQANATGNAELARSLGKLTPETIKHLIEIGTSNMILIGKGPPEAGHLTTYTLPEDKRLKAARELTAGGLATFQEDVDDFLRWVRSDRFQFLPGRGDSSREVFVPTTPLTPQEEQRLNRQSYRLNDVGKKAWDTVLRAVLQELQVSSACEQCQVMTPAAK